MVFYHPLTLGVRRSRPSEPSRALSKGPLADLSYEMWREGLARLDISYEEYPEARVLEAVRRAAAHASRRLWLILGEPGAGKSTLLKAWFERWAGALPEPELGNWNTPPEALAQLVRDPDEGVRRGAAGNPNTPPELLAELARDPDDDVRGWTAGNPGTPPEALAELARDPEKEVRRQAAGNPRIFLEDIHNVHYEETRV